MNETEVQSLLHEHADALSPAAPDPDLLIVKGRARQQHRRIAGGSGLLTLVASAVLAVVLTTGNSEHPSMITVSPPTASPSVLVTPSSAPTVSPTAPPYSPPAIPAGWAGLPTPPAGSGVGWGGSARVGTAIGYWGGTNGVDDYNRGAVLDITSRTWSAMTNSPLDGRSLAAIAGNDQLLFIWGGVRTTGKVYADGATYNVATRRWVKVAQAPLATQLPLGAVWTGSEFVVVGSTSGRQQQGPVANTAAYNPATNGWRSIPALPSAMTAASVLHASGQTVVLGTDAKSNALGSNFMYALPDGSSTWRKYAGPPNSESATLTATTDGTTIYAAARRQYLKAPAPEPLLVMVFDFGTRSWQDLNNPFNPPECYPKLAVTAKTILELGCTDSSYDRASRTWRQVSLPTGTPVAVDSKVVVSGYAITEDS
jgi:hypothetical protein